MTEPQFDIGGIEAEDDSMLEDAFVTTPDYSEALSDRVYLVLGRKGAGKTALFKTIAQREAKTFRLVLQIKPEDVNPEQLHILEEHAKGVEGFPKELFMVNVWKTFVWACVMRQIGRDYRNKLAVTPEAACVYEYVTQNEWVEPDFVTRFVSYATKVLREILKRMKDKPAAETLAAVTSFPFGETSFQKAKDAAREHLRKGRALVLIDHVDDVDSARDQANDRMQAFYECLITATRSLFREEGSEKVLLVKLALSSDILYGLKLRHLDKIMGHAHEIRWSPDAMKEFLARRLVLSPSAPKGLNAKEPDKVWAHFFCDARKITVDHDWRYAYASFDYMYYHSFRRPRDLMLCCKEVNKVAAQPLGVAPAKDDAVKTGVKRYCRIAQQYLSQEYAARCPSFKAAVGAFFGAEKVMSMDAFAEKLKAAIPSLVMDDDVLHLASVLYEMSAIGASYDRQLSAAYWIKPPTDVQFSYESMDPDVMYGCQSIVFHPVIAEASKMYRGSPTPPKKLRRTRE